MGWYLNGYWLNEFPTKIYLVIIETLNPTFDLPSKNAKVKINFDILENFNCHIKKEEISEVY